MKEASTSPKCCGGRNGPPDDDEDGGDAPARKCGPPERPGKAKVVSDKDFFLDEADANKKPPLYLLWSFADGFDIILLVIGTLGALVEGMAQPFLYYILADFFEAYLGGDKHAQWEVALSVAYQYFIIGAVLAVSIPTRSMCFTIASERMMRRVRINFTRAALTQEIGWYDLRDSGAINSIMNEGISKWQDAVGIKGSFLIQGLGILITSFALAFARSWFLTLIFVALTPIQMGVLTFIFSTVLITTKGALKSYATAGALAEETLTGIRTITALGGNERVKKQYRMELNKVRKLACTKASGLGAGFSLFWPVVYLGYATLFLVGGNQILTSRRNAIVKFSSDFGCPFDGTVDTLDWSLVGQPVDSTAFWSFAIPSTKEGDAITSTMAAPKICALTTPNTTRCAYECRGRLDACYTGSAASECGTGSDVLGVMLVMVFATFSVFSIMTGLTAIIEGSAAMPKILYLIRREPKGGESKASNATGESSDASSEVEMQSREEGAKANAFELQNVSFAYPSRPEQAALSGVSLCIVEGQTTALIGSSGCGKSTVMQMLQRFYDPILPVAPSAPTEGGGEDEEEGGAKSPSPLSDAGRIFFHGRLMSRVPVSALRSELGLVSQEPKLFRMTVLDNIAIGRTPMASREEAIAAAKVANAHDFITEMPDGYDTLVMEGGRSLSGGQKQRIAIARALIRDPPILLLDEATSALDTESEREVQAALDAVLTNKKRTTVVIAHRLSTIIGAEHIIVMGNGTVLEQGSHEELLAKNGRYPQLLAAQGLLEDAATPLASTVAAEGAADVPVEASEAGAAEAVEVVVEEEKETAAVGDDAAAASPEEEEAADADAPAAVADEVAAVAAPESGASEAEGEDDTTPAPAAAAAGDHVAVPVASIADTSYGDEPDEMAVAPSSTFTRVLRLLLPNWFFYALTQIGSLIDSFNQPFCFSMYGLMAFAFASRNAHSVFVSGGRLAAMMICFSGVIMIGSWLRVYGQTMTGELTSAVVREKVFAAFMRQDMGFFDRSDNAVGSLTTTLSNDAALLPGIGNQIAAVAQIGFTFAVAFGLALGLGNWKMTLACVLATPILAGAILAQQFISFRIFKRKRESLIKAAVLPTQGFGAIRTCRAFGMSEEIVSVFAKEIISSSNDAIKSALFEGMIVGFSNASNFGSRGLMCIAGGLLVFNKESDPFPMLMSYMALIATATAMYSVARTLADIGATKVACNSVFNIIDRQSAVPDVSTTALLGDSASPRGQGLDASSGGLAIELKDVEFAYPNRRNTPVLRNVSLRIEAGQTVAFVGPSGCGKSTIFALIERWYDVDAGAVLVDGLDVRRRTLDSLRASMSLVGQEPVLFNAKVFENIAFGNAPSEQPMLNEYSSFEEDMKHTSTGGGRRDRGRAMGGPSYATGKPQLAATVVSAAMASHALDFVSAWTKGFDTELGESSKTRCSGGEKQRIAIARALVRNPRLLLLDEATSALDTESEKLVQKALDDVINDEASTRTTIIIAHRLSTIVDADVIFVFENGRVAENGTHAELLKVKGGVYGRLWSAQQKVRE